MSLDDLVNVTITSATKSPSAAGFGTGLFLAYHTVSNARVISVGSVADVVTAGFSVNSPTYKAASKYFGQPNAPKLMKIGRRALPPTQVFTLTVQSAAAVQGNVINVTVGPTLVTYTVGSSPTTTTVATALAAAIVAAAVSGVSTSVGVGAVVTTTMTAGTLVDVQIDPLSYPYVLVKQTTTDPGVATDLAAIAAVDNDWYGLGLDSPSKAEILAAAAWVESNKKIFPFDCNDGECLDGAVTTDVLSSVKTSAYARSGGLFIKNQLLSYAGMAWMGLQFTAVPGSDTWAFKTLAGVNADALVEAEQVNITNKNGSFYIAEAGVNMTHNSFSGAKEYLDIVRFRDWLKNSIQVAILTVFANTLKVPFTDLGTLQLTSAIRAVLKQGITNGGLAATPEPTVSAPLVATVASSDRAGRNLPNISFSANFAGAIQATVISGVVSV